MSAPRSVRAQQWIDKLSLVPHPERGFFVESHRTSARVQASTHPGERAAATAIYFLITSDAPATSLHRLLSDEVFHLYEGGPLSVLRLFPDGRWDVARLGSNLERDERPQLVIRAGTWFGTELDPAASHCLIGCTVAPGFEFEDFELAHEDELEAAYPEAREHIARLRRP